MEIQTEKGLQEALRYIENGNPVAAIEMLGKLFENDLSCHELAFTARCCTFWVDIVAQVQKLETPYERGETLVGKWKIFLQHIGTETNPYEPALYAIQRGIFGLALGNYTKLFEDNDSNVRANAFWRAGICYKKLGEFETAQSCLREAISIKENKAAFLAEFADCLCLCGDDNHGKLFFREAFFLNPMQIDLEFLDSELICSLIKKTAEKGYSGQYLSLWIPVYGVLWGVFTIKRGLRSNEVAKLRQDIVALENEMHQPQTDMEVVTPRLLNLYFWLIDYYGQTNDNTKKINDVLLKIKILDLGIHELYAK